MVYEEDVNGSKTVFLSYFGVIGVEKDDTVLHE
jgi:hypothetical protein